MVSNIFYFHSQFGGRFPFWLTFFTGVERNHQLVISGILQCFSVQIHHTISTHQNERGHILGRLPLCVLTLVLILPPFLSECPRSYPTENWHVPQKRGPFQKGCFIWTDHHFLDMIWMIMSVFKRCICYNPKFLTSQKKRCDPTIDFPGYIPQFFWGNLVAIDAFNVFARKVSAKDISSEVRFVGMRWQFCTEHSTQQKMNGERNLSTNHSCRKETWSEPNLYEDMFQPLIFRGPNHGKSP